MSCEISRILPPRFDVIEQLAGQIPNALWGAWRLVPRENGKPGKIPCRIGKSGTPQNISHDNSSQWASFADARAWYAAGGVEGVGLLIGAHPKGKVEEGYSSGLVALDIDGCLDETGELAASVGVEVRKALEELRTAGVYIEISPSGTGLRALWLGARPEGIGERWAVSEVSGELYDGRSSRFVTVTGHAWTGSTVGLIEAEPELDESVADWLGMMPQNEGGSLGSASAQTRDLPPISDDALIIKIKESGKGKGKRLFAGNKSEYVEDWSAADAALCRMIARWSDDEAQVARVWGKSALADRDKFRTRKDYRERTVAAALASARADASKGKSSLATAEAKAATVTKALTDGDQGGVLARLIAETWGGKVPSSLAAAEAVISYDKRLAGAVAYDNFSGRTLKLRSLQECCGDVAPPDGVPRGLQEWSDADDRVLTIWLERVWGIRLQVREVSAAIDIAAHRFSVNLVVDALEALAWDGVPRLDSMLVDYFNADEMEDHPRYLATIGRKWMVATVARAYEPGCKHDAVLVMQGGQGVGKSSAIRELVVSVAPAAFLEGLPSLDRGVEADRAIMGVWVCELSELACLNRSETEAVKGYLSRQVDDIRHPHEKRMTKVPRTVSFCGTTNNQSFIKDTEGRRFWVLKVRRKIDIGRLRRDAPQLWAEAVAAYKAGEPWYLEDAEIVRMASASQERRLERDGWDELIETRVVEPLLEGALGPAEQFDMQALHLWELVRPGEAGEFQRSCKAFSQALTRAKFEARKVGGKSMWRASAELIERARGGG